MSGRGHNFRALRGFLTPTRFWNLIFNTVPRVWCEIGGAIDKGRDTGYV
jgi:hypothetical protein